MIDLDALRAKYPHLGFAVYAYDPAGAVTLEAITREGKVFTFQGPTLAEAIVAGFGEETEPQPEPAGSDTAPASVFD